ncbi:acyl-CoA N-acyltransferase [Collybia nuda]|uniref:Acyl-CoA N-acyltransferase n=1 Tax=Collybia nuda TaxID=64659 RepID=A0A9P5XUM4_9AGAR|nr:acyl-CoA N-acyltransferase [Collybia nuda]
MEKPVITISPALPSEIPRLASIFTAAFATDAHTQLKAVAHPSHNQERGMTEGLEYWISSAKKCVVIKATIDHDIVGWTTWGWHGFDLGLPEEWKATYVQDTPPNASVVIGEEKNAHSTDSQPAGIKRLKEITNADMEAWENRFMPNQSTECMILAAIAVHPDWQGKGVGSRLINWGLTKAHKRGVFTWVSSSDGGWGAFEKAGFEYVGELRLDLDEFSDGIKREDGRPWGEYVWRYGKIQPKQ